MHRTDRNTINFMVPDDTFEKHYRIGDLAEMWSLGRETIRRMLVDEPGVIKVRMGRRKTHTTYELVDITVTVLFTKLLELVRKGLVFGKGSRLDRPVLAACNECVNRIRCCDSLRRSLLGCWRMCDCIPSASPFELTAYCPSSIPFPLPRGLALELPSESSRDDDGTFATLPALFSFVEFTR
jgi:hypothetical protein